MDERSIFLAALEKENPRERAAFLNEACGNDPELRRQVEALLQAHADPGSFLEQPPLELAVTTDGVKVEMPGPPQSPLGDGLPFAFLSPSAKPGCLGLLGEYEILEVVGRGGMGIVFRALDPRLNRIIAIKVLAPELAAQPTSVQRFLREARAAAAVNHPNVVNIYHVEDRQRPPYLVMEFIAGRSLQQKIEERGALEVKEILRIGLQAAAGIAAAHKQGLVHRDIKPANILLENGVERVKITDFGLARAVDDVRMTKTGTIVGTPQYMSPEQANSQMVDGRSDLFSLGGVLYVLATGRPPFRGNTTLEVIFQVCEKDPKPIQDINPDAPDWLAEIIDKLMAKDREDRFQSASELARLLESHLAQLQQPHTSSAPARVGRVPSRPPQPQGYSPPVHDDRIPPGPRKRSSAPVLIIILVVCAILGMPLVLMCLGVAYWVLPVSQSSSSPVLQKIEATVGRKEPAGGEKQQQERLLGQLKNLPKLVSEKSFHLPMRGPVEQLFKRGRISPNGRYLAVVSTRLAIFDLQARKELHDLPIFGDDLAFSPDSKTVTYVETGQPGDNYLVFLTIDGGQKRLVEQPLRRMFSTPEIALAFSSNGQTVALVGRHHTEPNNLFGRAALLDVKDGKLLQQFDLPWGGLVSSVALAPDGKNLLTVGEMDGQRMIGGAGILDFGTGQQKDLSSKETAVGKWVGAVISPDGTKVAAVWAQVTPGQRLLIWDVKTGNTLGEFSGLGALPTQSGLVISPDGKRLVVPVSQDAFTGPVGMVINLDTVRPEAVLWRDHRGGGFPHAIGFAEDGRTILTVDSDGTVHQWGVAPKNKGGD